MRDLAAGVHPGVGASGDGQRGAVDAAAPCRAQSRSPAGPSATRAAGPSRGTRSRRRRGRGAVAPGHPRAPVGVALTHSAHAGSWSHDRDATTDTAEPVDRRLRAPSHADVLRDQFSRYAPSTTCASPSSSAETLDLLAGLPADEPGGPPRRRDRAARRARAPRLPRLALGGADGAADHHRPHGAVPRPRGRAAARAWPTGKYDAYLLMPRGVRDEEFHTAITELLSDWGSAAPVGRLDADRLARRWTR